MAKRSSKADNVTAPQEFDSGPVKIIWIRIVSNPTASGNPPVNRLFFEASEDPDAPPLYGYFALDGHSDWARDVTLAMANNTSVEYRETGGEEIALQVRDRYLTDADISNPPMTTNTHQEVTDIRAV